MVELKQLAGILNTDDPQEDIPANHHSMATNIRWRGMEGNLRPENVPGTRLIPNANLPVGNNEGVGAFFDEVKQRIFWCNYNSGALNGIFMLDIKTEIVSFLLINGTNTNGTILNLDLNNPIVNMKILYGDSTEGDILYFNNSLKQPCKINIDRALAGGYGTIQRSYIDVAKAPPTIFPICAYENDSTVTVNNLRKRLFIPKYRFWYDDKEKSVWSGWGVLSLPANYADTNIDKDPTKNCRIGAILQTGPANVKKIEIAFAQSIDNVFSDFFQVAVIDKAQMGLADNDIFVYRFLNNQSYNFIDTTESILLQDKTPLEANALELLNGNVPIYGGIKENYNPAVVFGSATSSSEAAQTTQYSFVMGAVQSGESGFGSGEIHIIVIGISGNPGTFNIYTTNETISYTALTTDQIVDIINGLKTAASGLGFTINSFDGENLRIVKNGEVLLRSNITNITYPTSDSFAWDWTSRYAYAQMYFDPQGRTCGMVTNPSMTVQTIDYNEIMLGIPNIPKINISISNRPPLEAAYFSFGRTNNLTKSNFRYWVSDRTFKDSIAISGQQFAYISIESLNVFIKNNPTSSFLAYDFSAGDRIRFIKSLSNGSNTIYVSKDYEIQAQLINPEINGIVETGQFLKIALPTTDATFDFGIVGTTNFYNYFFQVYTPAKSVANGLDVYYEFGKRYAIGDMGLPTRFHQGQLQNQSTDLTVPATYELTEGDVYFRNRSINVGNQLDYTVATPQTDTNQFIFGSTLTDQSFNSPYYYVNNNVLQLHISSTGWRTSDQECYIRQISASKSFTVSGNMVITPNQNTAQHLTIRMYIISNDGFSFTNIVILFNDPNTGINGTPINVAFSANFTLTTGQRMFILLNNSAGSDSYTITSGKIKIVETGGIYTVPVMDKNFSDYFQSAVNSNGRSSIVDPNAAQVTNPTLLRWALPYQPDTNINQANRFYPLNFDEVDLSKGAIGRMKARERELRIFQAVGCCVKGIYAKYIKDNTGSDALITTDTIITQNNTKYYEGEWGIGDQIAGVAHAKIADYFVHPPTGQQIRLSQDGLVPISTLYKGQYFLKNLLVPYNNIYTRPDGGTARIISFYDHFEDQCMTILQGGTNGAKSIPDYLFSFTEKRNAYNCFYDFHPEWAIGAQDKIYSWKNGQLYVHDDESAFRTFYGTPFFCDITLVFNKDSQVKKSFLYLGYDSNQLWTADTLGDVLTSTFNPQTGFQQISQLIAQDFEIQENRRYAAFLRDANSIGGDYRVALNEGDYLKGIWLQVKLTYRGTQKAWLYQPFIDYSISPKVP